MNKEGKNNNDWQQIITNVPEAELRSYINEYAKTNKEFRNNLKIRFTEYNKTRDPDKYLKIIRDGISNAADQDGYYYDTDTALEPVKNLMSKARDFISKGNINEAFLILSAIPPECVKLFDCTDDSYGDCGNAIVESFNSIVEIYETCRDPKLKEEIFVYLLGEAEKPDYDDYGCADDLEPSLIKLADSQRNIETLHLFLDRMLKKAGQKDGSSKEYATKKYLTIKKDLFLKSGKQELANEIINENIHFGEFRKILIDEKIENNEIDKAIKLIQEGIEIAKTDKHPGTEKQWMDQLLAIFLEQNDIQNIRKYSLELYYENRSILAYYRTYKNTWNVSDWRVKRQEIIEFLQQGEKKPQYGFSLNSALADLYEEEKMYDELYQMVIKAPAIRALSHYSPCLKNKYSGELLTLYKTSIENYLYRNTGRSAYVSAAGYIKEMLKLNNGKEFVNSMLANLIQEYKNRPAMKDEFIRAGLFAT